VQFPPQRQLPPLAMEMRRFFILIEFVIAVCNFLLGTSFCEVFPLPESLLFISVGAVSDARYFDL